MYHRIESERERKSYVEIRKSEPGRNTKIYLNFCVFKFFENHFNHFHLSLTFRSFQFAVKVLLKHLIKENFSSS